MLLCRHALLCSLQVALLWNRSLEAAAAAAVKLLLHGLVMGLCYGVLAY
jgi:hypothetical protein